MPMIIFALVIIVAAIALPLTNYFPGEIFPNEYSVKFSDILEVIKSGEDIFEYAPSLLFIIAVGCAVLLLIGGACRSKGLCMAASLCGIIGMIIPVFEWIEKFDISIIIGTKGTITAIGYWVCLAMFVFAFIGSIIVKMGKKAAPAAVLPREFSGSPDLGATDVMPPEGTPVVTPAVNPVAPTPVATTPVVNPVAPTPVVTPVVNPVATAPAAAPAVSPVATTPVAAPPATGSSKLRSTMGMGKGATKKTSTASPKDYGFLENQDL